MSARCLIGGETAPDSIGNLSLRADLEILTLLLQAGADVYTKDRNGSTALHRSVKLRDRPAIQELINHRVDLHANDKHGGCHWS